jgi:predicted transcriptional regulator
MELPTPADLKNRRNALDITQSALAERADVSQPLIARIEGGDVDPRLSTLRRIVEALDEAEGEIRRAKDVMNEDIVSVREDDSVAHAIDIMGERGFSQLLVVDETGNPTGLVTNGDIRHARQTGDDVSMDAVPVADVMSQKYGQVEPTDSLETVDSSLDINKAVIVKDGHDLLGIITEADVATHLD